jgi:hypothetical protein
MQERKLELIKTSIYKIDLSANEVIETIQNEEDVDFNSYIRGAIADVSIASGGRKFTLRGESTQVVSLLLQNVVDEQLSFDETIPDRLLREETVVRDKIARMGRELHEGLLIISIIIDKDVRKALLCKIEDNEFISKKNHKLDSGYPLKRKIFRSAQFILDDKNKIVDVVVHDLNSKGATYWWDDFLELDQLWDDTYNTTKAFHIIDTKVLSKIKKDSESDHTYLRNATIRYFRTNQEFTIEKFIAACFEGYEPVKKDKVNIDDIVASIKALPEKFSFDERFNLKPSEITAKIKYAIHLTDEIDLVIKDEINIENTITPEIVHKRKYIRIRSDKGYDAFFKNKS